MPPQANQEPLGWNATASTVQPSAASGIINVGSPSTGFHSHAVPSVRQQVARASDFCENVAKVIGARGPSTGGRSCWVLLSQKCSRESGSALVTATQRPSGLP